MSEEKEEKHPESCPCWILGKTHYKGDECGCPGHNVIQPNINPLA